jgi:hypothetical protein
LKDSQVKIQSVHLISKVFTMEVYPTLAPEVPDPMPKGNLPSFFEVSLDLSTIPLDLII